MEARPTTSMKKGWLCRTSCDENNHEIAPVMIQRWWSNSDDPDWVMIQIQWWWSSSDDPVVMIRIQWWSRSSDDDLDWVMIQIQWCWSSRDDPDQVMIQIQGWWSRSRRRWLEDKDDLKMKMTWRWWELDDDPDDTEKKTCADKLCRDNTFLVKRECWCNCNFKMYSLVYLMYCTSMFPPGGICNVIESCHAPMFPSRVYIMWTSHVKSLWVTLLLIKG